MACDGRLTAWLADVSVQIPPLRIARFNQLNFPSPTPVLDAFFPRDCALHCFVYFVPDQIMHTVALCEPWCQIVFVLPNPLGQICGYANIQRTSPFAGEDIHARRHSCTGPPALLCGVDSGFRRNDGLMCRMTVWGAGGVDSGFRRNDGLRWRNDGLGFRAE